MAEKVIIGNAELWLGDCREVLPTLPKDVCIVSDPPYGISYKHGGGGKGIHSMGNARTQSREIVGDNEPFDPSHLAGYRSLLFGADHFANRLPEGGMFHVWDKDPKGLCSFDSFSDAEIFWTSWTRKRAVIRYLWKGLCQPINERRFHPTMKPQNVMAQCIEMIGQGVICDPYMGSGSTGVAAMQMCRTFIGIECEPDFFDIACRRIEDAQRQGRLIA